MRKTVVTFILLPREISVSFTVKLLQAYCFNQLDYISCRTLILEIEKKPQIFSNFTSYQLLCELNLPKHSSGVIIIMYMKSHLHITEKNWWENEQYHVLGPSIFFNFSQSPKFEINQNEMYCNK